MSMNPKQPESNMESLKVPTETTVEITQEKRAGEEPVTLEKSLQIVGDGVFHYRLSFVCGMVMMSTLCLVLTMSYAVQAAYCDLNLTATSKGILASITFYGMIIASYVTGSLSDWFGRRYVTLRSLYLCSALCLVSSFSPEVISLTTFWFFIGVLMSGIITPVYVYVNEFCPENLRNRGMLLAVAIGSIGYILMPVTAWLILPMSFEIPLGSFIFTSWRLFIILMSLPLLFSATTLSLLPETPKFTLACGDHKETLSTLRKMFVLNKKSEEFPIKSVTLDHEDISKMVQNKDGSFNAFVQTMISLLTDLFHGNLLLYTMISSVLLFGIYGTFNMILIWLPGSINDVFNHYETTSYNSSFCEIPRSTSHNATLCQFTMSERQVFVNVAIGSAQLILFAISQPFSRFIGEKNFLVSSLILAAVSSFLVTILRELWSSVINLAVTMISLGTTLPLALSITVNFFPTYLRSTATCFGLTLARAGSALEANFYGMYVPTHCQTIYYTMSILLSVGALMCIFLPMKRMAT